MMGQQVRSGRLAGRLGSHLNISQMVNGPRAVRPLSLPFGSHLNLYPPFHLVNTVLTCILHISSPMKAPFQPAGDRGPSRAVAMSLVVIATLLLSNGCSKAPPPMDQKVVAGDAISAAMCQHYGWILVSAQRLDENSTTYLFTRPENYAQSVQDAIAEASANAKDKARLADKELSEIEKTDGKE
jgi:hypothetical protein